MITNPKIERKKKDIARTEARFAEVKAKLKEQKLELINLENDEIVAMFRSDIINEDDFALLRKRRETEAEAIDEDESSRDWTAAQNSEKTDNEENT